MKKNCIWGGNMELQAFSMLYSINIIVHVFDKPPFLFIVDNPKKAIHLSYHNGDHYNSIRWKDDINDNIPKEMPTYIDSVILPEDDKEDESDSKNEYDVIPGINNGMEDEKKPIEKVTDQDLDQAIENSINDIEKIKEDDAKIDSTKKEIIEESKVENTIMTNEETKINITEKSEDNTENIEKKIIEETDTKDKPKIEKKPNANEEINNNVEEEKIAKKEDYNNLNLEEATNYTMLQIGRASCRERVYVLV